MSNHGNASIETETSQIKTGHFGEFAAAVVSQLWAVVSGFTPATLQRLIEDRSALRGVLERAFVTVAAALYPFAHRLPWWNDKWRVAREGTPSPAPLDFTKLELVSFHKEGESLVSGEEMLRRANDPVQFPGCQGWGMHQGSELYKRRAEIPESMRGSVILLPDTILLAEDGIRCVAYLFFYVGEWQFFYDLARFDRDYQFVRLSK